jgi:hypothetical protein
VGVAKDRVLSTAPDGLLNGRGHRKVHVSNPEGNEEWLSGKTAKNRRRWGRLCGKTAGHRTGRIPFDTARIAAVYYFVKIEFHLFFEHGLHG